jgi:hypothetical protein
VLLALALGTPASQFGQDASTGTEKSDQQNRDRAVGLGFLRAINTAEATDFFKYGSYSSWQTLLVHQSEYSNGWLAKYYSHELNTQFGDPSEILPGFRSAR